MTLKTRLDGRSKKNASFQLKNSEGKVIATVKSLDSSGINLEVSTAPNLHIEKPSGWSSKQ